MRDSLLENIALWRPEVEKARKEGRKVFFCGHFGIFGAKTNDGYSNQDQSSIRIEDLESIGADYAYLGDYHVFQVLRTDPSLTAIYTGSLERTNFIDVESPKGFIIHGSEEVKIHNDIGFPNTRFVENANVRLGYVIKGCLMEIEERIEATKDNVMNAVVKID